MALIDCPEKDSNGNRCPGKISTASRLKACPICGADVGGTLWSPTNTGERTGKWIKLGLLAAKGLVAAGLVTAFFGFLSDASLLFPGASMFAIGVGLLWYFKMMRWWHHD